MQKIRTQNKIKETFENPFEETRFRDFIRNLLNHIEEEDNHSYSGQFIATAFQPYISTLKRIGKYSDGEHEIDILVVRLKKETSLERARTAQRNFIARYLNGSRGGKMKDAALVAFVSPNEKDWRFSLIKMDYKFVEGKNGKTKVKEEFTPARRWSFLVGPNEHSHTAQAKLAPIIEDENIITLARLEEAFNIEKVTKEFFDKYRNLFADVKEALDKILVSNDNVRNDFIDKSVSSIDFSKRLLGQIVFLYFLQKKGWFGVPKDKKWGEGDKNFLRNLFNGEYLKYKNFYNDILEPLFYDALALDRSHLDHWNDHFKCKIPFLNGGLFDNKYNWHETEIELPNDLFSNNYLTKEKDKGTGILDIFDRYNFTVKEDEPLEKEVAVDPEMLGKVFENLLEVKDRKSKGTYYTPREIVHYMCEQSLVNYLAMELKDKVSKEDVEKLIKSGENVVEHEAIHFAKKENDPNYDGLYDQILPASIEKFAKEIDEKLVTIKVCDPAIGSGAFPVGMMNAIVKARMVLSSYLKDKNRTLYVFKRDCIQNSLYGVDIDPGAVEIAKLRLWLSLVVDEDNIKQIKPLPNLDYKIMQGNSLLEEFEGIKLFDEKLLQTQIIDSNLLDPKNQIISELQSQLLKFYGTNPQWMQKGEHKDKPLEVIDLEIRLRKVLKEGKKIKETSIEQKDLFTDVIKSRYIREELENLHKKFFGETNKNNKDEIKEQIENLEWELIEATLKEQGKTSALKKLEEFKRSNTKPFFLWKLNFADVFESGGFSIVITNPPYVRQEEIEDKSALQDEYKIYNAVADLYTYFYEKGFELLKTSGVLTFITSNKFLRARYGISLRGYLKNNLTIKNIINFGDKHMFEAITNTLIFIAIKGESRDNIFNFSDTLEIPDKLKFEQEKLQDSEWTIEKSEVISLKTKIEDFGIPLLNWDVRMNRGLLTGYNEAYIISEETKNELIKKEPKAADIIKPIIRGRDIERYYHAWSGQSIIFIPWHFPLQDDLSIKKSSKEAENKFNHDYPVIYKHLSQFKKDLSKRNQSETGIRYEWYAMQRYAADYIEDFKKEKIVWIELANNNRFSYSKNEEYVLAGAFIMTGESLKYLIAFLNSKLCLFYFSLICNSSGMATIQWKKFALEKVPIPKLDNEKQKPFIELVEKVLEITKKDDYLKNTEKQAKVRDLEHQIDELVYKLYGLTDEEIKIVEAN